MTQPTQQESGNGQVIAAAVAGLALVALEARIRSEVEEDVETAMAVVVAALLLAVAGGAALTGTELLSLATVHKAITTAFGAAKERTAVSLEAGYAAAAQVALVKARRDMKAVGHEVPSTLPELGTMIEALTASTDLAYDQAVTDLQNTIREAFDDRDTDADLADILPGAAATSAARLNQRLQAAAGIAAHQGASDAQNAIYADFTNTNPYLKVRKRWRVTAADPCKVCAALHGTDVAVNAEFDHEAGRHTPDWRPVWRNLQGPPRHPNCRCQLELVTT